MRTFLIIVKFFVKSKTIPKFFCFFAIGFQFRRNRLYGKHFPPYP